jgi:hypothetical protein
MTRTALTERYLEDVARRGLGGSELREAARRNFDMDRTSFGARCMSRPAFLGSEERVRLDRDLGNLYTALAAIPGRLFGGDLGAFARAAGMTDAQVTAIMRGEAQVPTRMGRADLYSDGATFQLMEVNMGSAIGGLDNALFNRAFLRYPAFAEFAEEHALSYVDTMAELAHTLITECAIPSGQRPVVAAADWPASFPALEAQLRYSAEQLAQLGIDAYPCHVGQLRVKDGRVWLEDRPVDVVYRLFMIEDLLEPEGPALVDPVLRAAERGEVAIFAPMHAELFGSKSALAMLSDERHRHLYGEDELASLDRILPWTRMVRPGPVTVDDEQVELTEYAIAEREELVLKPTMLHGGHGVVPGWLVDADEWTRQLAAAMDGSFVVQRRIRPLPELFPAEGDPEPWVLTWGAFLATRGYAGALIRGIGESDGGVVSMATGAICTCCFHAAEPASIL